MNQLEVFHRYQRQLVINKIVSEDAIFLGDIYISFNDYGYEIHNNSPYQINIARSYKEDIVDASDIMNYIYDHFIVNNHVVLVGCSEIYLVGEFTNQERIVIYNSIMETFLFLQSEYAEYVNYVDRNLDEIIRNGGELK